MSDLPIVLASAAILIGLAGALFVFASQPAFWIKAALYVFPYIVKAMLKRMSPEDEAMWRDYQSRGMSEKEFARDLWFKRLEAKRKAGK